MGLIHHRRIDPKDESEKRGMFDVRCFVGFFRQSFHFVYLVRYKKETSLERSSKGSVSVILGTGRGWDTSRSRSTRSKD